MIPGIVSGSVHVSERAPTRHVQVARGPDEVGIEPVDRHEQRQDREGQEAVRHAQDHGVGASAVDDLIETVDCPVALD